MSNAIEYCSYGASGTNHFNHFNNFEPYFLLGGTIVRTEKKNIYFKFWFRKYVLAH